MKIRHREPHGPLRRREYPDIGDQLDAIYHLVVALKEQGIALPDKVNVWVDQCAAVKRRYPKPQ